jgi:hypothetical protein
MVGVCLRKDVKVGQAPRIGGGKLPSGRVHHFRASDSTHPATLRETSQICRCKFSSVTNATKSSSCRRYAYLVSPYSHLLGKKSWNVYNPANIERVRRDEAEAAAKEAAEEQKLHELEAARRMAVLRGETPPPLPEPEKQEPETRRRRRDEDRPWEGRKRKRRGEDDTDFEMRVARERNSTTTATGADLPELKRGKEIALIDSRGNIDLFSEEQARYAKNQKNDEAEREKAAKKREMEDQYTMRFTNAAGRDGFGTWYAGDGKSRAGDGTDAFGRPDPGRKDRDASRMERNDPLATMRSGAKKVREIERERKKLRDERERELKELKREERRRAKRRRRERRDEEDELEGFSLDAPTRDQAERPARENHHEHVRRHRDDERGRHRSSREDGEERHGGRHKHRETPR